MSASTAAAGGKSLPHFAEQVPGKASGYGETTGTSFDQETSS